jgi:hypothetical protein
VEKVILGWISSEWFSFPYKFSFHQILLNQQSSGADTVGQLMAKALQVSGLNFTSTSSKLKTKKKNEK